MSLLTGQVGIVTGAGRGIGRAIAEALSSEGMSVGLIARSRDQLEEVRAVCEARGGLTHVVAVDVADRGAVRHAVDEVEQHLGSIELLVNNAGTEGPVAPLWEAGQDAWWHTIEVDLGGPLAAAAAVLPGMVARGHGRIVQMNSLVGTRDRADYGAYAVAKGALLRLGGVLAASLSGSGVVVLDMSPGLVRTQMTERMPMFDDVTEDEWTPIEKSLALVIAIAQGRLDLMAGRFVHAEDDWEMLASRAQEIIAADGRTLRLLPAWAADQLFD